MKLRHRGFENEMGARVKHYDPRGRMGFWERLAHFFKVPQRGASSNGSYGIVLILRGLSSAYMAGMVLVNYQSSLSHPDLFMAWMGLWGLLVAACRALYVWAAGQLDMEHKTLRMLPVSAEGIWRHLLHRLFWGALVLFFEFLFVFAILATTSERPLFNLTGAAICAAMQAGFSLVITLFLVALKIRLDRLTLPILALAGLMYIASEMPNGEHLITAISRYNPMGWINAIYLSGWMQGNAAAWWNLLPILGMTATLPFSLRSVRRMHHDGKFRTPLVRGARQFSVQDREVPKGPVDLTVERQQILGGDFLQPFRWERAGFAERLIARLLKPSERAQAELLLMAAPQFSRRIGTFLAFLILFSAFGAWIQHTARVNSLTEMILRWGTGWCLATYSGGIVILALVLGAAVSSFLWFTWPFGTLRILPLNHWEPIQVIAKINGLTLMLLLPPAILLHNGFPLSWFLIGRALGGAIADLPIAKCLVFVFCASLLLPAFGFLSPRLGRLNSWLSQGVKSLFFYVFLIGGLALLLFTTFFIFSLSMLAVTAVIFFYSKANYLSASR